MVSDYNYQFDNRHIVHIDLDTFFVSVERLQNSALDGVPVIIGGLSDRGVVAGCSYESRRFGVHSAMPMRMARQLCPQAVFIRGDMDTYSRFSNLVTEVIADRVPLYEKASIDEHYLDLTGMDRYFGCYKFTHELRETIIRETGLPISFGLSVNKTVSKIATGEAKKGTTRELYVEAPRVKPFLNPLSISKIPMLGPKTYRLLRSMGVDKIETLSLVPPEMMERVLGKNGIVLWQKANGIDPSPVERYYERKSIGTEQTFETDTTDFRFLNDWLLKMVEKLAFELRVRNKLTACVTVKIRYADFDTHTIQKRIPYTSFDHVLMREARELLLRLYKRRVLVRLLGVRFTHLVSGSQQLNLFEDTPEQVNLYLAMDRIRKRFGKDAVGRAVGG
ncbi:DNA polymerase IV [Alkalitalea saponilacus]|uniref:DNA polymerase IV n=1 Tax=Alkalitalea saponilacus TaxID=889453 RepID=A0A1T5HK18_9BACT|nr:DNA polymerase IV [Alkalitalea saponilacus]ASB47757.1 DNA polymerase IV [Alkalitalea saponilacus]SKC21017.1 DNA polymerase-4 [Alkalitalea saponilacus]